MVRAPARPAGRESGALSITPPDLNEENHLIKTRANARAGAPVDDVPPAGDIARRRAPADHIPSFSIPSFASRPSHRSSSRRGIDPADHPSQRERGRGLCTLISPVEVGAILGTTVTVTSSDSTTCTYTGTTSQRRRSYRDGRSGFGEVPRWATRPPPSPSPVPGGERRVLRRPLVYIQRAASRLSSGRPRGRDRRGARSDPPDRTAGGRALVTPSAPSR